VCNSIYKLVVYVLALFKYIYYLIRSSFVAVAMESPNSSPKARSLMQHHKLGTDYIKRALNIDEKSENKDEAIKIYKLGIEEFIKGLDIDLDDEDQGRLANIQEKMRGNMVMALERVEELTKQKTTKNDASNNKSKITRRIPTTSASGNNNATRPTSQPAKGTVASNNRPTSSNRAATPVEKRPTAQAAAKISEPDGKKLPLKDLLKLPNVDKQMIEIILDEIVEQKNVKFSDIIGQDKAKQALTESVILPTINPGLFTGLLQPLKGLLLFGPPGNGKTMLAKAAANEAKCNFFNINSSSLTSKWMGEGEKLVRTLFAVARHLQPSIIFIDEIDSILCERKDNEHEASRRLKTEFFSQFDGMQSNKEDRILVMGATNRPFDLDSAALRRFPKRIYVGIPDLPTRAHLIAKLLQSQSHTLSSWQLEDLAARTDGYSGSDLNSLATEAAYGPIREKSIEDLKHCSKAAIRPISYNDFIHSLSQIKVTPPNALRELNEWNRLYGANS